MTRQVLGGWRWPLGVQSNSGSWGEGRPDGLGVPEPQAGPLTRKRHLVCSSGSSPGGVTQWLKGVTTGQRDSGPRAHGWAPVWVILKLQQMLPDIPPKTQRHPGCPFLSESALLVAEEETLI